jgi:UDP-N-acetylmuramate dehydrogenase
MQIQEYIPLSEHTTLHLGGPARYFISATNTQELREALSYARENSLPIYILGGGSNILFPDEGWNGLVIHIALLGRDYEEDSKGDVRVTVQAGEQWDQLVEETVAQGLWGIENLSRIPGTVGAAPVQNIGAYGVEVKDVIEWVEVLDIHNGDLHIISKDECAFGYRDSIFKHRGGRDYIITRVAMRLSAHPKPNLEYKDLQEYFGQRTDVSVSEVRNAINEIREKKYPSMTKVGSAGSFFKNPIVTKILFNEIVTWLDAPVPYYKVDDENVKIPVAWLLERFGWKGKRVGNVGSWNTHPLFFVHYGGGTSEELIAFAEKVMNDVKEKTNIDLVPEIDIVQNE